MTIHRAHAYPAPEDATSPGVATTFLSRQDEMISRFILPLIVSIAAHIFLPPVPAAIVTVFCLLSALAPGARNPRIVIARRHFWNPLHVFHRPWTARILVPQSPFASGLYMDRRYDDRHPSTWSSSCSACTHPTGQRLTGTRGADAPRDSRWIREPYVNAAPTNQRGSDTRRPPLANMQTGERLIGQRARDLPRDQTGQTTFQGTPVNSLSTSSWIIQDNPVFHHTQAESSMRSSLMSMESSISTPPFIAVNGAAAAAHASPPTGSRLSRDGEETGKDAPRIGAKGTDSGWVTRKDS
jgi:hypothetical protein